MTLVASNQVVEQTAATTLKAAIDASADFASWVGWEYLQQNPTQFEEALRIVAAIDAGKFTLDDLCSAAQSKTGAVAADKIGNPDPSMTVLGHTFDIGHLLGNTTVDVWTSGQAKNLQYHSREYFTSVGSTDPKGYVDGWENPNKAPVAVADTITGNEDAVITGSVATNDSDANNDGLTYAADTTPGLTFKADGSYEFDTSAYQYLAAGESKVITVNYTVTDGKSAPVASTLTITVNGVNDKPMVDGNYHGDVQEDGNITASGQLNITDADHDQSAFKAQTDTAGKYGTFSIGTNGDWTYAAANGNSAIQHLHDGESLTESFDVVSNDGSATEKVTVTIHGTDDMPTLTGVAATLVDGKEDTVQTISAADLLQGFTDGDGDTLSVANLKADHGTLVPSADGTSWTFTPDENYNGPVALKFNVVDGHGSTVAGSQSFTIDAVNDAPVAQALFQDVNENGLPITLTASYSDVDIGDSHTFSVDTTGTKGLVVDNGDGTFSYDANGQFEFLADSESATDTFTYTVDDGNGGSSTKTATITVHGENDAPKVSGAVTGSATEGGSTSTLNALGHASDVDHNTTLSVVDVPIQKFLPAGVTYDAASQSFTLNPSDAAYNHLAQGASTTITVSYNVTDEHGAKTPASVSWTVAGTNDAPVVASSTISVVEDGLVTGNVGINDKDADDGSVMHYALNAPVAGLMLNDNGTYTFDASHADYQSLHAGKTMDVKAEYTVTDDKGASVVSSLTIKVTGAADLYHGTVELDAQAKTAAGGNGPYHFDFALPTNADAFNFSNGVVHITAKGDLDEKNEQATILQIVNGADLLDANGGGTGLLQLSGTLNNGSGVETLTKTWTGDINVAAGGFDDGHVKFDGSFSGMVANGTTIDATLTYDFWA